MLGWVGVAYGQAMRTDTSTYPNLSETGRPVGMLSTLDVARAAGAA